MTVEQIWILMGISGSAILYYFFDIHLLLGAFIGAFLGFIITTVMKLSRCNFGESNYSNDTSNEIYSEYWE